MKFDTKPMEERTSKAIASFETTLSTVRASQANAGVLARVNFDYYGSPTPLNSMADIRVADARTLVITPYDATTLKAMEKAWCNWSEDEDAVLMKGTERYIIANDGEKGLHIPIIYGDFFFAEAILKLRGSDFLPW